MRIIAICARNIEEYHKGAEHVMPGMSRYHQVTFKKVGLDYVGEKFKIVPALQVAHVRGLEDFQLIKFGSYEENPEYEKIQELYDKDVERRKGKQV